MCVYKALSHSIFPFGHCSIHHTREYWSVLHLLYTYIHTHIYLHSFLEFIGSFLFNSAFKEEKEKLVNH